MLFVSPGCKVELDRGPDLLFVRFFKVPRDRKKLSSLADGLWKIMQAHLTKRVILEMDQLQELTHSFVEQLNCLQKKLKENGGMMRLSGLSEADTKALNAGNGDADHLPSYDNRTDAVMGGFRIRKPR